MSRIEAHLSARRKAGRPALIMYLNAFDPNADLTLKLMKALVQAGVDLIELCYPFSDPILDGPVIQQANKRSIDAGGTLSGTIEIVARFREHDQQTPVALMGYAHPIVSFGVDAFVAEAEKAGADGLIIADLPLQAAGHELLPALRRSELQLVPLSAPMLAANDIVSDDPALGGFVYCIAAAGPTGGRAPTDNAIAVQVARCRSFSELPVAVGFGVKTPSDAVRVARHADGVVVATALVDRIARWVAQGLSDETICAETRAFVRPFRRALDQLSGASRAVI